MRQTIVLITLLAVATLLTYGETVPSSAQTAPTVQVTNVDSSGWPRVVATVTVLDASGRPVTGLATDAFSGDIGGQPLGVASATPASADDVGIAVVATFDTSGSMVGEPLAQAQAAAKGLVAQIRPGDQAAIVSFSNTVRIVQGFTADPNALNAAIDSLVAVGDTALYAAVRDSIALADTAPLPRRSIILLSDGVDFGSVSGVTAEETLLLADQSDAIIFAIGLGPTVDEAYLSTLAQRGRGQYLRAPTPEQLSAVYQDIASILRNQYVVEYDASDVDAAAAAGQPLNVTVNVGGTTATGQAAIDVPTGATPVPTPVATPVATEVPSSGEQGSSSGFPLALAAAAVAGGVVLLVAAVFFSRRLRGRRVERAAELDVRRFRQHYAAPVATEITRAVDTEKAMAWTTLPDGTRTPLGMTPVTIGFGADSTIQLPGGTGLSLERARVFWRDGSFMLHNLSRTGRVSVGGKPVTWVVLENGDQVEMGNSSFVFVEEGEDGDSETKT